MKHAARIAALLAATVLLVTGCGGDTSWVYSAGNRQVPAGIYINNIMTALSNLESADYEANDEDYTTPAIKDFLKMTTEDGMTYSQKAVEEAKALSAQYLAVEELFDSKGLALESGSEEYADGYADYIISQSEGMMEQNGISKESIKLYQLNQMKEEQLFEATYGEGGEQAVGDEDLKALFQKDYIRLEMMYVTAPDVEGAENTAERERAQAIFERYKAGETIEDLDYEYRRDIAADDAKDSVTKAEPGDSTLIVTVADAQLDAQDDPLMAAVLSAKEGEPVMIEDEKVFYIFKKKDLLEDPADFAEYRHTLLHSLKDEEFDSYLREYAGGMTLQPNDAALRRYTPEKIKVNE